MRAASLRVDHSNTAPTVPIAFPVRLSGDGDALAGHIEPPE
jgi:hypothetical protein